MNAALSGAVSNDPLLYLVCTAFAALGVRHVRQPDWSTALLLGAPAGLAVLTKTTGIVLVPNLFFVVRDRRQALAAFGVAALIAAPWLVRNELVYGHPLATNVFNATFPASVDPRDLRSPRGLMKWIHVVGAGTSESMVGRFGDMDILLPSFVVYPLILMIAFGLVFGFRLVSAPARFRVAAGALCGLLVLGFLSFDTRQYQAQARLLFPAIGLLAYAALLGGLLIADAFAFVTLPPEFTARRAYPAAEPPSGAQRLAKRH